jgi:hypothetical protein
MPGEHPFNDAREAARPGGARVEKAAAVVVYGKGQIPL